MSEQRVVVVTGSSAGIGRATAEAFGRRGWRVGLLARGIDGLEAARSAIRAAGGEALVVPTDVADYAQVEAGAERVEHEWGSIDVWINNAMATIFCDFLRIAPEDFRRATEVTYLGAVWGTLAALKRMTTRNRGTIVQVGSALAYRSIPLQAPYCGAKSGLRGFTDSLRSELIHTGSSVRLTMVHLAAFNTPQFDWGRTCLSRRPQPYGTIFQPEVAAEAIYWASQHDRRELWVGLSAVEAILGQRLVPRYLDRRLAYGAYSGQQTDQPVAANRADNLYAPVPGDHGSHGRFDARAKRSSPQLWLDLHRWVLGVVLVLVALVVAVAFLV
ncbi:MAG TPA: SDR family oxidoreductase [Rhizomicrobium sp.]|jgi:NAD(P)-dependent dehydrogenase (short-subunit alcohol dehydrogenase family)